MNNRKVSFKPKPGESWLKKANVLEACMEKFRAKRHQHIDRLRNINIEAIAGELLAEIVNGNSLSSASEDSIESHDGSDEESAESYESFMLAIMEGIQKELEDMRDEKLATDYIAENNELDRSDWSVFDDDSNSIPCPTCRCDNNSRWLIAKHCTRITQIEVN